MEHAYSDLKAVVDGFKGKRLMVVGDLLLDQIIRGEVTRISPEAPVPVVWSRNREEEDDYLPGGACNVARNLSSLGAEVTLIGLVGRDEKAEKLKELLRREKVNIEGVISDGSRPTTLKTRVVASRGLHQQVLRIDREKIDVPSEEISAEVGEFVSRNIEDVDGIIIEDYGKGLITPSLIEAVVSLAARRGKMVAVDPKENHFEYYRDVSVITPNHHEAGTAVGFDITDRETLEKAGRTLLEKQNADVILITRGEKGMMVFEKNKAPHDIPTRAQEVADVSGAGDTVIAVYTLSVVSGATPVEAAEISNCAAGVVVAKAGPAVASVDELLDKIRKETGRSSLTDARGIK
ncbi:MAG: D-glycero-beta-D-manno-heptose-7-phosphate kinase [Candidatus Omnitrophica bacterium]|nr:D-glycero-beta-D-manno-heptose-7-phosphate kinase [Candidatus Omnitrophota bacterium]